MTFKKYNTANNAICSLDLPITNSSNIIIAKGNFNRFPTSNFIIKITQYNGSIVIGRENILISSRSGSTFSVLQRAVEPVPIDDNASSNIQQALSFDADSIIELVISSATITDIQDEVTRLENDKLNKSVYNLERQVFSASSTGNDSYKITSTDVLVYNNGQTFKIQADVANTDASTLELNSLGAKSLKKYKDGVLVELETGDIVVNQIFWATYNNLNNCFQFSVDPASVSISDVASTKSTFIAGEDLIAGNVSRKGILGLASSNGLVTISQPNSDTSINLLYSTSAYEQGQGILATKTGVLKDITVYLTRVGTGGTGFINIKVYSNAGFTNLIGTSIETIEASTISTGTTAYTFNFLGVNITSGNNYYYKITNINGVVNTINYITVSVMTAGYANGIGYTINSSGGVTNQTGIDHKFIFNVSDVENINYFYKADASSPLKINLTGFVANNVSFGGNVTIDTSGISNTQTGLTTGSDYYLSNTPGAISTTPGTNIVSVGKAVSKTGIEINIDRVKQLTVITPTVGASPYTYQNTTGRPIILSITGGTVSQVAYSRDNTNYYQTSAVTNTFVYLGINDYVKVTYSVIPTLKTFTF